MFKQQEAPAITFTRSEDEKNHFFISLLGLLTQESLLKCMHKFADVENYEMAQLYRDELIRRGCLKPSST